MLMSKQIAETVNAAMAVLPEELRTAITLREIEGLSYEEIAEMMGCPIGTVRSRIFRARESHCGKIASVAWTHLKASAGKSLARPQRGRDAISGSVVSLRGFRKDGEHRGVGLDAIASRFARRASVGFLSTASCSVKSI